MHSPSTSTAPSAGPSKSRRGRGSVVWRFFDFSGPDRTQTVCRVCDHTMTWDPNSNSTSNMLKHCRNKHPDLMEHEYIQPSTRVILPATRGLTATGLGGLLQEEMLFVMTGVSSIDERMSGGEGGHIGGVGEELQTAVSPETVLGSAAAEVQDRDPTPPPTTPLPQPKPESYQLRHNNHLTIVLEALAQDESFMDVTLTAQGRSLKAHKSVLSAVSPYFRGVLRENPCQHPIIIMPRDVRYEELYSIVNYIYKGEMTVAADDLTSLLKTAELLQVSGLAPSNSPSTSVNPNLGGKQPPQQQSGSNSSLGSSKPRAMVMLPNTDRTSNYPSINPADFMDVDMTYVKEEVASDDEEESSNVRTNAMHSSVTNTSATTTAITTAKESETKERSRHNSTENTTSTDNLNKNSPQSSPPANSPNSNSNTLKPDPDETPSLTGNSNSNLSINSNSNSNDISEEQATPTSTLEPFTCPHCNEGHRGCDVMASHLRLKHPTKPSFLCLCGRVFLRQSLKQAHARNCPAGINN